MVAAATLALLLVVGRLLERPRPALAPAIGVLLAVQFTIKETAFITVAVLGSFLVGLAALQRRDAPRLRDTPVARALGAPGLRGWLLGAGLFVLVFAALFTSFGTNPGGLWDAVYAGPRYWLEQQPVNRGGERWPFHLLLIGSLEWPVLVFGIAGLIAVVRRPTPASALLAWAFLAQLVIYSWASERFAWLTLHPLVALIPLAGIGVVATARARSPVLRGAGIALAVAGAAYLGVSSWVANGPERVDPRSLLVAPQTSEAALGVRDALRHLPAEATIDIDTNDSDTFPWAWYLRDRRLGFIDMRARGYRPDAGALVVSQTAVTGMVARLRGYRGRRFVLRAFWGRDYRRLTPAGWWRWVTRHEPWSPLGDTSAWLYERNDRTAEPAEGDR